MVRMTRRDVMIVPGITIAAAMAGDTQGNAMNDQREASSAKALAPEVTRFLAEKIAAARYEDLPEAVRKEGKRTLLNWVGCAIGGSHHEAVSAALAAITLFAGPPQASLLGRRERTDIMNAALLNGIASHVFDFDDTHLKTIIHPAGPVASAILAYSEHAPVSGKDFLNALVLGVETECRLGNAVYPEHYALGWHITGTCGVFGAAAAMGKLLGLDQERMANALGIAATQQTGLKIMFGSMTKSFHPGRAAQHGMLAALLAAKGFTATARSLEGKDGWAGAVSPKVKWDEVTEGWGTRYEAALNTYKPFACGIVAHPSIDGIIQLRNEHQLTADKIQSIALDTHPLVLSLMGKTELKAGLEGKFSIYHAVAVGLIEGKAGERQFSDRAVLDPVISGLRKKVAVSVNPAIKEQQARITVTLSDGTVLTKFIERAVGSTENPMSDTAIENKVRDLAQDILPPDRVARVIGLCWDLENLHSAGEIATGAAAA